MSPQVSRDPRPRAGGDWHGGSRDSRQSMSSHPEGSTHKSGWRLSKYDCRSASSLGSTGVGRATAAATSVGEVTNARGGRSSQKKEDGKEGQEEERGSPKAPESCKVTRWSKNRPAES